MPRGVDIATPLMGNPHPPHPSEEIHNNPEAVGDESVEVVLNKEGATKVMEKPQVSDVFRHGNPIQRPRAMQPMASMNGQYPGYPPYPGSGSWGYGPYGDYRGGAPYPVPPYASGSFEDHYTPHGPYRYASTTNDGTSADNVNVISPNHKTATTSNDPQGPPMTPRSSGNSSHQQYLYPPASPVSRPGQRHTPRLRSYPMRRGDPYRPDYDYYTPARTPVERTMPPVVADSFDSGHASSSSRTSTSHDSGSPMPAKPSPAISDPHMQFYGAGSWGGSFDAEDSRVANAYYGFPPDSPYSPYPPPPYSPGTGIYHAESFPSPHGAYSAPPLPPGYSYSYDDHEAERLLHEYNPDTDVSPLRGQKKSRSKSATPIASNTSNNTLLPKAAEEIDFEVTDPPMEPKTPESLVPLCESIGDVNSYDVLCGRGGGTNSQIGNRRFRQLVQDFQPVYLVAKRKEKPLLARTIVLIIRKRGGRFLKKNEDTGELWEVGDEKAEAKTSQALREGLDVRATKASAKLQAKKGTTKQHKSRPSPPKKDNRTSPPTLPKLHADEGPPSNNMAVAGEQPSPTSGQFRKRRRVRSADKPFFNDFMPPRAEINRNANDEDDGVVEGVSKDDVDMQDCGAATGCAGIAFDIVSGAATGSFCLGPMGWRR